MRRIPLLLVFLGVVLCVVAGVHAASLTYVSDRIVDSAPSIPTSHFIQFTAFQAIPASGHIVIAFDPSFFIVPTGFDVSDVDLLVASSGPPLSRTLANTPSAFEDGVAVISGASGSITITLNSTTGIAAGETVQIVLGTAAQFDATGGNDIVNPSVKGSYHVYLSTTNQSNAPLDRASAMIAVVAPVTAGSLAPVISTFRFNGLPSGDIAAGNSTVEISFETLYLATCRYATSSGVLYTDMTGSFTPSVGTLFYTVLGGHQNSTTYNYYVRCINGTGTMNDDDYVISFHLKDTPISDTSIAQVGSLGPGGIGSYPNGVDVLYLASVTISGWTAPNSSVVILKDGGTGVTVRSGPTGSFEGSITDLERGTYTFQVYSVDSAGRKSGSHSVTLSLTSGTNNTISNVVLAPTIAVSSDSVSVGEPVTAKGESIPNGTLELTLLQPGNGATSTKARTFMASSTSAGTWQYVFDQKLPKGTYYVKVRALDKNNADSDFSPLISFGVGKVSASDPSLRADINKDGKVNLIDFSILLSNWGGQDPDSDINQDGAINLADFSVQLFYWTG